MGLSRRISVRMRTALLLLYAGFAALGTYLTFRPTFDSGFTAVQTERGDGMLNHFILENSWLSISDPNYCGTLVTPPFCFPERGTIYYSENLFGSAPVYWALRLIMPYDHAYMWWQIVLSVLNYLAFALVARWFRLSHVLSICGAFLWAFAMVHADQIKHQQMIGRMWMPFAVYYAAAFVTEPAPKTLNRLLGSTFLQCLACFYSGWFLVMGLGVFLPALVVLSTGAMGRLWQFLRGRPVAMLRIVALWGLLMAALFAPYILLNPSSGHRYEDCSGYLPTPAAWITGPSGSRWEQTLAPYSKPVYFECKLFSGFGIDVLMLAAAIHLPFLRRRPQPLLWPIAMAGVITAAVWWGLTISTAPDGDSLWWWVRLLPGGGAVRVVSRVYIVVYLFGSLAALMWLHLVTERIKKDRVRIAVLGAIAAVLIWEQTGVEQLSFERRDFYSLVDQAANDLKGAKVGYVVPRYKDTHGNVATGPYGEVFGMWVGLRANVPVVNGYSGVLPPNFPGLAPMTDDQIRTWLQGRYRGTVRVIDSESPGHRRDVFVE